MPAAHRTRRKLAAVALVLAVAVLHGWVVQSVVARVAEFSTQQPMPPRMVVTYVRQLQLAPPPAVPPALAPAAAKPRRRAPLAVAAAPASAPASEPEPITPAPPEAPVVAASAPEPTTVVQEAPARVTDSIPAAHAEPFQWPPSTRLSYTIIGNYRGEIHGDAQVEWLRADSHYQVNVDVTLGPSFAPLYARHMTSEGELTENSLWPSRYDEDTRIVFEHRRLTVLLGPGEITLANGERIEREAGVQDAASQFVHLAALFTTHPELLRVGSAIELWLARPRKLDRWVYDVVNEETVDTPVGPLDTFHLKPRRVAQPGGDLTAEIWFAPQLRYLPVRILIRQDADTFVDLLIAHLPDLAAQ